MDAPSFVAEWKRRKAAFEKKLSDNAALNAFVIETLKKYGVNTIGELPESVQVDLALRLSKFVPLDELERDRKFLDDSLEVGLELLPSNDQPN